MNPYIIPGIRPAKLLPEDILYYVARYYKMQVAEVTARIKKKQYVKARHMAIWMIRNNTDMKLQQIAYTMDLFDHTSVIHAVDKINGYLETDPAYRDEMKAVHRFLLEELPMPPLQLPGIRAGLGKK